MNHLDLLQKNWAENIKEINSITTRVDHLWEQEEMYWLQRSRVTWLREGDANTAFFHRTTLHRMRVNKIAKLKGDDGSWVDDDRQVFNLVEAHFKSLFTSGGNRDWGDILNCIEPLVSDSMNADLTMHVDEAEIRAAVRQMGGFKAPGPNGFQGIFYHSY